MNVAAVPTGHPQPSTQSIAHTAFLPVLMVLGIALPLAFLARMDEYLYYLRPSELLPTYATAWILLAALSVLPVAITLGVLVALRKLKLAPLEQLAGTLVFSITATVVIFAALFGVLEFALTFSPATRGRIAATAGLALAGISLAAGVLLATNSRGRVAIQALASVATPLAILGALCCLTLPLFRWEGARHSYGGMTSDVPSTRPHILLVTIDALSAQHMSLYGARRPTTPRLDTFARAATVFDRAYANSNFTTSGVASILTGTRPWRHRAFEIFSWPIAQTRRASLPALLAAAGYQTGYVATNSYAGASRNGFGPYFSFGRSDQVPLELPCPDRIATLLPYECPAAQLAPLVSVQKLWNRIQAASSFWRANRHYDPGQATQQALAWLSRVDKRKPVFLWLHLFPPHAPYAAPSPWLGRFSPSLEARDPASSDPDDNYVFGTLASEQAQVLEARYDESVQYVDHYAGEFLTEALKLLGDNAVVVVMADHGESFGNGYGGHGGPGLFDSIIHIPLIVKLPGQTRLVRVSTPVEQIDIAPTLARLAGVAIPPIWEGRPLLPLAGPAATAQDLPLRPVFAMNFEENPRRLALTTGSIAVIDGPWKFVHYMGRLHYPRMPELHDELYDLLNDPHEASNRVVDQPQEAERLLGIISRALASCGGPLHQETLQITAFTVPGCRPDGTFAERYPRAEAQQRAGSGSVK